MLHALYYHLYQMAACQLRPHQFQRQAGEDHPQVRMVAVEAGKTDSADAATLVTVEEEEGEDLMIVGSVEVACHQGNGEEARRRPSVSLASVEEEAEATAVIGGAEEEDGGSRMHRTHCSRAIFTYSWTIRRQ
jgi:hypothetical protein